MNKVAFADYANVSGMVGVLTARGMATMDQLDTVYSLSDALNMLEIIQVQNYNEWVAGEAAQHG